jgi:pyruvate,water dikinase
MIWVLQIRYCDLCWCTTEGDKASSGVAFTIDPDTGFQNTIIINGGWGLGENIVKGAITPDEWMVFKPTLENIKLNPILKRHCGRKKFTMIYAEKRRLKIPS